MSTDIHTEERERLEDELRRIDATLSNGWIQTKPKRLADLTERRIEVMESLAAMDADESISNPESDSSPMGDDWEDAPLRHHGPFNLVVQAQRRKTTSTIAGSPVDASFEVVRELNIDTDYQMKKALTFARSLVGSDRQASLLAELRKAKVNYSKAIEAAVKSAGMEPA